MKMKASEPCASTRRLRRLCGPHPAGTDCSGIDGQRVHGSKVADVASDHRWLDTGLLSEAMASLYQALNAFLLGFPALFSIVNPISGAFIFREVTADRA